MESRIDVESSVCHECQYCGRDFQREQSLLVHMCEPKRRFQERHEVGVQLGLQCYLRFYQLTQGSSKLKTWDDFAGSAYYRAFVKFGRYCQDTRAINVAAFCDWLIKNNRKIDHWCRDSVYGEYLLQYLRLEPMTDALSRAIETALAWEETANAPSRDYLRYSNSNKICHDITTGRLSPWALYNCESGQEFLSNVNSEQLTMIWPYIESDFWQRRFRDYAADAEYAKQMLSEAGW